MNCSEIRNDLPDAAAGRLPEASRREIERHLAQCASCRSAVASMREALARAGGRRLDPPDAAYWSRFSYEVNERLARRTHRSLIWIPRVALPSLVAILLLVVLWRTGPDIVHPLPQNLDAQIAPILTQANEGEMEDIYEQYADKAALLAGRDLIAESRAQTIGVEQQLLTEDTRRDIYTESVDYLPARDLMQNLTDDEADAVTSYIQKTEKP